MKSVRDAYGLESTARGLLHLVCGCLFTFAVGAEDWPAWMGPSGQNRSGETGLADNFDRGDMVNIKWAARLGTVVFGSPTISNGKIFVGTNAFAIRDDPRFVKPKGGVLVCLDEVTGETFWRLVTPVREDGYPEHTHMINQRWGICSSPTVDEDRIYLITNGDDLICLDIHGMANGNDGPFQAEGEFMVRPGEPPIELTENDADIIWRYDIPRELAVAPHDVGSCSVLVDGDIIYTSTSNGLGKKNPAEALMPDAPAFIALDKRTGRLLAIEDEQLSQGIFHAQWSPPSKGRVGDNDLIFLGGGDGFCYAFEAIASADDFSSTRETGRLKTVWKYDCNPLHHKFTEDGDRIWYYQGDTRVYKSYKNAGRATGGLNSGDGSFVGPNEILTSPVFYKDRVYVATGRDPMHGLGKGMLHCIDATQTGDISETGRIWSYEGIGRTLSTVAIGDGLVYAADLAGSLHCLDAETGELYWVHETRDESWGNPLLADGKVYFNTTGTFWILAAGKQKEVLFEQRGGSEMGAVAANGVVYAFMRGRLYAIAEGAQGIRQARRGLVGQGSPNTPESDEDFEDTLDSSEDASVLVIPEPSTDPPIDSPRGPSVFFLLIATAAGICTLSAVIALVRWAAQSRTGKGLSIFERYLTLWVGSCIVGGIALGKVAPGVATYLDGLAIYVDGAPVVSIPIAVCLFFMMYPIMVKIDFAEVVKAGKNLRPVGLTLFINWAIKPFTMYAIASLFLGVLFRGFIGADAMDLVKMPFGLDLEVGSQYGAGTAVMVGDVKMLEVPLWRSYLAGCILLGIAPCTAMVLVWGFLSKGNDGHTLVMVAINSLTMLVLYGVLGGFLLGVGKLPVPWEALVLSISIYVASPLVAGYLSRRVIMKTKGEVWFREQFLHVLTPITIVALLVTLVLLFSFKGEVILANPLTIVWIAIPLSIQTILIFGLGYSLSKVLGLSYQDAAPTAMIGASNHFEVAIATAVMLFGLSSGAALATVVGVLIEVPLMLMLVRFCLRTQKWFGPTTE